MTFTLPHNCPACSADFDGGPIPDALREKYSPHVRWNRVVGVYDRNKLVAWRCPDCEHKWLTTVWKPIPKDLPPHGEYGPPPFDGKAILVRESRWRKFPLSYVIVVEYFPWEDTQRWTTAHEWDESIDDWEEWTEIPT